MLSGRRRLRVGGAGKCQAASAAYLAVDSAIDRGQWAASIRGGNRPGRLSYRQSYRGLVESAEVVFQRVARFI